MLVLVVKDQSDSAVADLRRKLVGRLTLVAPSSQELEPPANPGRFIQAGAED